MNRRVFLSLLLLIASVTSVKAESVTFNKDVAPILWKNCANCHRPGEVGPFPLLTYKDAAKRAEFLKDVTSSRRMPPWHAEPGFGEFHDARRLSDKDIKTLASWADAGTPEGNPRDLPKMPVFPKGWQLGTPDLILKMPKSFTVPAGGRDVFRCFVIPIPIEEDRTVAAVEFRPGNRKVVHHALLFLDRLGQGRKKEKSNTDGKPGYTSFGGIGILPTGGLGGWAPGAMPRVLPDGTGQLLKKGSDLVLQIHYHPSGKEETDQSVVGISFTKKPAKKIVAGIALRSRDLNIPPGESKHIVKTQSAPLPADVDVLSISPHMHNIGKQMKVVAHKPDGKTVPMIWISDWDFNWQGAYRYEKPVRLPKGTVLKLEAIYDNSAENSKNPNSPPKRVRWGEQTTDEMCLCGVSVVTDTMADLKKILSMRGNRLGRALSGGVSSQDVVEEKKPAEKSVVPPDGVKIPERSKEVLGRYDTNGDGKLTQDEIDAMPAALRERVLQAIRRAREEGKKP